MTKAEKLLQKIRNNPKQVSFEDLDRLLRNWGFVSRQSGGGSSHYFYYHPMYAWLSTVVPKRRPHVHTVYVHDVLDMISEIEKIEGSR